MSNDENINVELSPVNSGGKFILKKKTALLVAVVIIAVSLLYVYKGFFVAATVNGVPISRFAVIHELEKNGGKDTLNWLITQKLIINEASLAGVVVSDEEINEVIKNIGEQITEQGATLEAALGEQGMTLDDFKNQIIVQKNLEKLLGDKINITDEEINQYIEDFGVEIPEGEEENYKNQIKEMLRGQKLGVESQTLMDSLKSQAKINYFVSY